MHPVLVLIPAVALILGPQLWVRHVLGRNNRRVDSRLRSGGELARELLDRHRLHKVKVESTDLGDHYDPDAKAVRLTRDKITRKSLTAVTVAAHEVGHALQDASGYTPFVWRARLGKVAQVTGQAGTALLLATPVAAIFSRQPIPAIVIGGVAFAMLGTGVLAQLAALPTELDASFGRAMPLLQDGYITPEQEKSAREILTASSLTYVASSLAGVLTVWRWWAPVGPVLRPTTTRIPQPRLRHPAALS
ncbi:MAG: zinc metallopeptidase [Gammaproteobacteria bacterium]|nr:zinc metallopeptidase [Gammaproteobacteria bacterium]